MMIAQIPAVFGGHWVCTGFTTLVVSEFVVVGAAQTHMQVGAAVGTFGTVRNLAVYLVKRGHARASGARHLEHRHSAAHQLSADNALQVLMLLAHAREFLLKLCNPLGQTVVQHRQVLKLL
jgi:hypothetical protein